MEYPFNINGLSFKKNKFSNDSFFIDISNKPELFVIENLFEQLSEEMQIFFYDPEYPSISDPGAYVNAQKLKDKIIYQVSNHGWSSKCLFSTNKIMAEYLYKSWNFNTNILRVEKSKSKLKPDIQ